MKKLKIRLAKSKSELSQINKIKEEVFVKEQGVAKDIVFDKNDAVAKHVIAFYNNKVVGCARIRFINNKAKLERIAVLKQYRGKSFGKEIMDYLVDYCRRRKAKEIYFHSQYHAKGFYEKCGFKARGKPFQEAKIKHIGMFTKP